VTDTDPQQIDAIERDRRRRERDLLELLAALTWTSRSHAVHAARSGNDPVAAARMVFLGDNGGHFIGAAPIVVAAQSQAYDAGYRRAGKIAGGTLPPVPLEDSARQQVMSQYRQAATDYSRDLADRVGNGIRTVVNEAMGPREELRAIRGVFDDLRISRKSPGAYEADAERAVCTAYNAGMMHGAHAVGADPLHHLCGFEHVSVIDSGTTEICKQRHGLRLPADHPYWKTNWCPLHFGCRSVNYPLFGRTLTNPTVTLPTEPPAPGFGHAPSADLGSFFNVTR
jgi:SPP1 gp7 family putative phage head morphogenesis protein